MLNETELIGKQIYSTRPRISLTEWGQAVLGGAAIVLFIGILIIFAAVSR